MAESQSNAQAILRKRTAALLELNFGPSSPVFNLTAALAEHRAPAVIFGGTLRDLLIYGSLPRDIDLVVRVKNLSNIESEFRANVVRHTRFGGLRLAFGDWTCDIWPLTATWAFQAGIVRPPTFPNLPKTTFLDIEAVAADLNPRPDKVRRIYSHHFFEAVDAEVIDINLEDNPFPELCIVRSLLTAARLRFSIGPRLSRYICTRGRSLSPEQVEAVQREHYGEIKCDPAEILSWIQFIDHSRLLRAPTVNLPVSLPKSLALQRSWKH
jgi:hypothetical protein